MFVTFKAAERGPTLASAFLTTFTFPFPSVTITLPVNLAPQFAKLSYLHDPDLNEFSFKLKIMYLIGALYDELIQVLTQIIELTQLLIIILAHYSIYCSKRETEYFYKCLQIAIIESWHKEGAQRHKLKKKVSLFVFQNSFYVV